VRPNGTREQHFHRASGALLPVTKAKPKIFLLLKKMAKYTESHKKLKGNFLVLLSLLQ
jgi:hypothetical protein